MSAKHYGKQNKERSKNTHVIGGEVRLGRQWQHHSGGQVSLQLDRNGSTFYLVSRLAGMAHVGSFNNLGCEKI